MSESLRTEVVPDDVERVRQLVASTGFFYDYEVAIAVELVEERLAKGPASGYEFVFAERDGRVCGYTCYGEIACTVGSYDLYWIAVEKSEQGRGTGRRLLVDTERRIADRGGRCVYIETSNRPLYVPTRTFYERCGYHEAAVLPEFYGPGDDKVIFAKRLN